MNEVPIKASIRIVPGKFFIPVSRDSFYPIDARGDKGAGVFHKFCSYFSGIRARPRLSDGRLQKEYDAVSAPYFLVLGLIIFAFKTVLVAGATGDLLLLSGEGDIPVINLYLALTFFYLIISIFFIPFCQIIARLFNLLPPLQAYSINIVGNIIRIIDDFAFQSHHHLLETAKTARILYPAFCFSGHKLFFSYRSLSATFIMAISMHFASYVFLLGRKVD